MVIALNYRSKAMTTQINVMKSVKNRASGHNRILQIGIVVGIIIISMIIFHHGFSSIIKENIGIPYRIVPEHERFLNEIVISLGPKEKSLDFHSDFLCLLPNYTKIFILLPESHMQSIEQKLIGQPYCQRTQLIGFDTKNYASGHAYLIFPEQNKLIDSGPVDNLPRGSFWAQDLFEVATKPDGKHILLISDLHKWFISVDPNSPLNVISDNFFLSSLSSIDLEVKRLPLTFRGGNVLFDEFNGKKIVVCGGDVYRLTQTVWKSSRDSTPTEEQVSKMILKYFNVDDIVIVGKEEVQPSLMFHLDQAMVFLSKGIVGITNIVGKMNSAASDVKRIKEVEAFLSELRSKLSNLEYKLVNIDTSIHNVVNYQYYVNGVPYVDAITGQKTFIMPVYPSNQTEFEKELVRNNILTFEKLGYQVVPAPSKANELYGGIHCLSNVLN